MYGCTGILDALQAEFCIFCHTIHWISLFSLSYWIIRWILMSTHSLINFGADLLVLMFNELLITLKLINL